jgi:hypothetical protein
VLAMRFLTPIGYLGIVLIVAVAVWLSFWPPA